MAACPAIGAHWLDILEFDRMPRLNLKGLFGALTVGILGLAKLMARGFGLLKGVGNMAHRRC